MSFFWGLCVAASVQHRWIFVRGGARSVRRISIKASAGGFHETSRSLVSLAVAILTKIDRFTSAENRLPMYSVKTHVFSNQSCISIRRCCWKMSKHKTNATCIFKYDSFRVVKWNETTNGLRNVTNVINYDTEYEICEGSNLTVFYSSFMPN